VPGKKKGTTEEHRLAYTEIAKARVEIEFSRKDEDTDDLGDPGEPDDLDDSEALAVDGADDEDEEG
jgi:ribosome maturation factor RimP